jgi:hypothetical protein
MAPNLGTPKPWYSPERLNELSADDMSGVPAGSQPPSGDASAFEDSGEENSVARLSHIQHLMRDQQPPRASRTPRDWFAPVAILAAIAFVVFLITRMWQPVVVPEIGRIATIFNSGGQRSPINNAADDDGLGLGAGEKSQVTHRTIRRGGSDDFEGEQSAAVDAQGGSAGRAAMKSRKGRGLIKQVIPPWALQPPLPEEDSEPEVAPDKP